MRLETGLILGYVHFVHIGESILSNPDARLGIFAHIKPMNLPRSENVNVQSPTPPRA